jgi:thioredoxin 1
LEAVMAKRILIGSMGAVAVVALWACDSTGSRDVARANAAAPAAQAPASADAQPTSAKAIPRLVDLGAGKCIPCKAMAPILDQLRSDYAGRMEVVFIDVWQRPEEADAYRIRMIPTQIFYGADGRELARHEGFIDRAQILARWKALGVEL